MLDQSKLKLGDSVYIPVSKHLSSHGFEVERYTVSSVTEHVGGKREYTADINFVYGESEYPDLSKPQWYHTEGEATEAGSGLEAARAAIFSAVRSNAVFFKERDGHFVIGAYERAIEASVKE